MAQLAALRNRIKSVQTTKKITHAMRLISISLYGKTERQTKALTNYHEHLKNIFNELGLSFKNWLNPVLMPTNKNNPLYIIISSSKGLCGGFHNSLERYIIAQDLFNPQAAAPTFITLGSKSTALIKKLIQRHGRGTLLTQFNEYSSKNVESVVSYLITTLKTAGPKYSEVFYVSNAFHSFFACKQRVERLIPLTPPGAPQGNHPKDIMWEQPQETILTFVANDYVTTSLRLAILSSLQSEHSARFLAMESATNNATKMLDELTLELNKKRQTEITKEVAELSAGC
jgi:F-type H+-transporting ATPase subunit gamma